MARIESLLDKLNQLFYRYRSLVIVFTHQRSPDAGPAIDLAVDLTLALTAEERTRTRHRFLTETGDEVYLNLPRGTTLRGGDLLGAEDHNHLLRIEAKLEPVMTVRASDPQSLLKAAYHLGNRHVSLEVTVDYLRLSPDSVLEHMLHHLGVDVNHEMASFEPESGAYGHVH